MKPEDRYHRFVRWSDEDQCYIGYCPRPRLRRSIAILPLLTDYRPLGTFSTCSIDAMVNGEACQ